MSRRPRARATRSRLRRWAAIAAIIVGGLVASGTAQGAKGDKVELTWFVGLGATESAAKERTKAIDGVAKAFNKRNRGLELDAVIEAGDMHIALGDLIANGAVPDVIGPMTLRTFSAFGDSFADLAPLAATSGFDLAAYDQGLLDAYRNADGGLVGIPFGAFPTIVYYNRDLFDQAGLAYPPAQVGESYVMPDGTEAPWDWATLTEIAKRLTVDANGNDANSPDFDPDRIVQFGFHDQFPDFRRSATFLGGPASLVTTDASGAPVVAFPEPWRDAVSELHGLVWQSHVSPTAADVNGERLANNPFASGHVAMASAALWYTCCIADSEGRRLETWDIAVLPTGLTGTTTSPLQADALAISATSPHPEEAFAVLRYLVTNERAGALWQVAPASADGRREWYRGQERFYGGDRHWEAVEAMLGVPDVPSHQADLPAHDAVQQRLAEFRYFLGTLEAADVDVDAELDRLTQDLQAIVDGG